MSIRENSTEHADVPRLSVPLLVMSANATCEPLLTDIVPEFTFPERLPNPPDTDALLPFCVIVTTA